MIINIPFSGFYNTLFSDGLDRVEEYNAEYCSEEDSRLEPSDYAELFFDCMNYGAAYRKLAKDYAEAFNNYLIAEYELDIGLEFESMESPREYNYVTDRIFCHISEKGVTDLFEAVSTPALRQAIRDRFTSRSGFASFYPNELDEWPSDPLTWDHNQLGTLLTALLADDPDRNYTWKIYEQMSDDCDFDSAFDKHMDWTRFEERKAEIIAARQEEELNDHS